MEDLQLNVEDAENRAEWRKRTRVADPSPEGSTAWRRDRDTIPLLDSCWRGVVGAGDCEADRRGLDLTSSLSAAAAAADDDDDFCFSFICRRNSAKFDLEPTVSMPWAAASVFFFCTTIHQLSYLNTPWNQTAAGSALKCLDKSQDWYEMPQIHDYFTTTGGLKHKTFIAKHDAVSECEL